MKKNIKLQKTINEKLLLFRDYTQHNKESFINADIYFDGVKERHYLRCELFRVDKSTFKENYTDDELIYYCVEIVNTLITKKEGKIFNSIEFWCVCEDDDDEVEELYIEWEYDEIINKYIEGEVY